jgi:hypothetical protein
MAIDAAHVFSLVKTRQIGRCDGFALDIATTPVLTPKKTNATGMTITSIHGHLRRCFFG